MFGKIGYDLTKYSVPKCLGTNKIYDVLKIPSIGYTLLDLHFNASMMIVYS